MCQVSLYDGKTDCVIQTVEEDVTPKFGSRGFVYGSLSDEDNEICELGRKLVKGGMAKTEGNKSTTIVNFLSPLLHRDPRLLSALLKDAKFKIEPTKAHNQYPNKSNSPEATKYHQELRKLVDVYAMKVALSREQTFSGRTTQKGTVLLREKTRKGKLQEDQQTLTNSLQEIRTSLEIDKLEELERGDGTNAERDDKYPIFLIMANLFSLGVIDQSLKK